MTIKGIHSTLKVARPRFSIKAITNCCQIAMIACLPLMAQVTRAHSESALAFGFDNDGKSWYGSAYNHQTKAEAREAAMQRCVQQGPQCEVVLEAANACVALAGGDDSNASGRSRAATEADAQSEALRICVQYNKGNSCSIRESYCDTVSEAPTQRQRKSHSSAPRNAGKRQRLLRQPLKGVSLPQW